MHASHLTFRRAYEQLHEPLLRADGAAVNSFYTYRAAIRSWERHGEPGLDLRVIRQSHVLAFRCNLLGAGLRPTSFDAKWSCLKAIIATAVAEGLVDQVPRTPRIRKARREQRERPDGEEVARIMAACEVATWPKRYRWLPLRVTAPALWRSLYTTAYITGLRKSDLTQLRWQDWHGDGFRVVPRKTRRYGKVVWCPEVAGLLTAALRAMRGADPERIFPCGFRGDLVAEQQRRIAEAAGVRCQRATFQAFRRASLDAWCQADERAPELIAGHGLRMASMTSSYYVSPERQAARAEAILREAAGKFPVPEGLRAMIES